MIFNISSKENVWVSCGKQSLKGTDSNCVGRVITDKENETRKFKGERQQFH